MDRRLWNEVISKCSVGDRSLLNDSKLSDRSSDRFSTSENIIEEAYKALWWLTVVEVDDHDVHVARSDKSRLRQQRTRRQLAAPSPTITDTYSIVVRIAVGIEATALNEEVDRQF